MCIVSHIIFWYLHCKCIASSFPSLLFAFCLTIFVSRNLVRLDKELKLYNYNPLVNLNYNIDKKFYFRYINYIENNKDEFPILNFSGKNFMLTKKNK